MDEEEVLTGSGGNPRRASAKPLPKSSSANELPPTTSRNGRANLSVGTVDSIISVGSYVHVVVPLEEEIAVESPAPNRRRASAATLGKFSPRKHQQDLDAFGKKSNESTLSFKGDLDSQAKVSFAETEQFIPLSG